MDARSNRAEEIFCAANEMTDLVERRAFVDRACDGDDALHAEVEEMLAAEADAERFFLESSSALQRADAASGQSSAPDCSAGPADELESEEHPGTRIGPYKILQKLGEGGCGVVYLAEQEQPVRRRVALKIIKLGMDTRSVIARFRAEQQTLALMDHPNIAQVLDAGMTATGRPYFAMELVRGVKLTDYCDQHQLDARERLRLFIQICLAVQHAHQKGIIHRDLKPSNILVTTHDGAPVLKVIDFGIAKAVEGRLLDQTLFTAADQFIGTPAYMSPEQADRSALDVDTRSDIYSLGVLLYELLTGRTPFDTKTLLQSGMDEMRRTLREREPQRPSSAVATLQGEELTQTAQRRHSEPVRLISQLRDDLDWIAMKALEKDRTRRYQTANGLALDVQRYLDNEPVLARPPSQFYRLQKLVRRNRIVFAAGSVTAIALMASSALSTWLLFKERAARERAAAAEEQKGSLQQEADLLRMSVENQRKILKAVALFADDKLQDADAIIEAIPPPKAAREHASLYRGLGDWHALNGRWAQAKARFDVLVQINEFEGGDSTMDDIRAAALLVGQGQLEAYERFRESLITRYAGTDNPTIAQRIIRNCLLTPANDELMNALDRFAGVVEESFRATGSSLDRAQAAYQSYALALMAYRRGDYWAAVIWSHQARQNTGFQTRDLSVQLIQAMAHARSGQVDEARSELQACRSAIDNPAASGSSDVVWQGFWFDQICVQIHLREAAALIDRSRTEQ